MNKTEMEQSIDKMNIVIRLLAGHIPSMFARDTLNHAITAKNEMEKYLKELKFTNSL